MVVSGVISHHHIHSSTTWKAKKSLIDLMWTEDGASLFSSTLVAQLRSFRVSIQFSVEVNETETHVTTRFGVAAVTSDDGSVMLNQGQRAVVRSNAPPSPPLPAAQNLLTDSSFGSTSLDDAWEQVGQQLE